MSFLKRLIYPFLILSQEEILVGGQAVIEGVMMRIPGAYAVAVRNPKGEIKVLKQTITPIPKGLLRLPVIRGSFILFHSLFLGIKALNFSADVNMEDEKEKDSKGISNMMIGLTILLSLGIGIALFFYLPLFLTKALSLHFVLFKNTMMFNLLDGVIRLAVFLLYVLIISLMKDIRRVFEFHGAEHKVVYTWEAKEELTVENARKYSTLHPRCGTSFLLLVMFISIFVFALARVSYPFWIIFLSRLLLLPVIAGISYEMLRLTAKYRNFNFLKPILVPGLLLQKLTTRKPDDVQLSVAIDALKEALTMKPSEIVPA